MSLLERVVRQLESHAISFVAIGAAALAHHGVSRATQYVDLLCVDISSLEAATWRPLDEAGVDVEIRRGDPEDPLAGVVRIREGGERPVDLIVGKRGWKRSMLERAEPGEVAGVALPVARAADLMLLKLYAGGPQDAWDVAALLSGDDRAEMVREIEECVEELPSEAQELWERIR